MKRSIAMPASLAAALFLIAYALSSPVLERDDLVDSFFLLGFARCHISVGGLRVR